MNKKGKNWSKLVFCLSAPWLNFELWCGRVRNYKDGGRNPVTVHSENRLTLHGKPRSLVSQRRCWPFAVQQLWATVGERWILVFADDLRNSNRLWNPLFFVDCVCPGWYTMGYYVLKCATALLSYEEKVPSFIWLSLNMTKLCPLRWTDVANAVRYLNRQTTDGMVTIMVSFYHACANFQQKKTLVEVHPTMEGGLWFWMQVSS